MSEEEIEVEIVEDWDDTPERKCKAFIIECMVTPDLDPHVLIGNMEAVFQWCFHDRVYEKPGQKKATISVLKKAEHD